MNRWLIALASVVFWGAWLSFAGLIAIVHGDCWTGPSRQPDAIRACVDQKRYILIGTLLTGVGIYAVSLFYALRRRPLL